MEGGVAVRVIVLLRKTVRIPGEGVDEVGKAAPEEGPQASLQGGGGLILVGGERYALSISNESVGTERRGPLS